jgi:thioredoxin-related protein
MKQFITIFFCALVFTTTVFAQEEIIEEEVQFEEVTPVKKKNEGIKFSTKSWSEMLTEAKADNKLIFVDAYAQWCGPCKTMSKRVFSVKKVGDFFNAQFVNAKIDMEKGEGPKLAKQYHVRAYPTFLFVDGDGKVVHRSIGYHNPDQLLELGSKASNPMMQLASLDAMYEKGERNPDFLYKYALAKSESMDGSHRAIAEEYLATQSNWKSDKNLEFIYKLTDDATSKMFQYFVKNKADFIEKYGERAVGGKIQGLVQAALYDKEGDVLANAAKIFPIVYPERANEMVSSFKMLHYFGAGDGEKYAQASIAHYKEYKPAAWDELNEVAWNMYEIVDEKKYLKKGVKFAKKSIKMSNQYYNNDTLAALYFKLGKKGKALKAANKAIYLAKEEGEDASETLKLLEQIKAL